MAIPTTAEAIKAMADIMSNPTRALMIDKEKVFKYLMGSHAQQSQRVRVRVPEEFTMGMESNEQRFRSFAERYVIARAATFRAGQEDEDGWAAALVAKSLFRKMEAMGRGVTKEDIAMMEAPPDPQAQTSAQVRAELRGAAGQMATPPVLRGAGGSVVGATAAQLIHPNNIPMPKVAGVQLYSDSKGWTG